MLLVVAGGIVFSIVRWKRHPKVSLLTLLGLAIYFLSTLFFIVLLHNVSGLHEALHMSYRQISYIQTMLFVLDDFAYAAVLIVLVAAAFTQRGQRTASELEGR
jgi:hypothetical protein